MRTLFILTLSILLAACTPVGAEPGVTPEPSATVEPATPTPEIFMPVPDEARAEIAAREALAQRLGLDFTTITVLKIVKTDWPDSCLGLTLKDQACQIGPVPGFRVVLEVNDSAYEVRTDLKAQTVLIFGQVDATLGELPAVCQGIGLATYYAPENDFCFAYPAQFTLGETNPTRAELYGPALDQNPEPLRAALYFEIRALQAGEDLTSVVDAYLAEFEGLPTPAIVRRTATLGGQPAEQLDVVPGREGSRDVFMVREGVLFHLMFMPSTRDFPQAAEAVEDLFLTVTSSFMFLSAPPTGGQ